MHKIIGKFLLILPLAFSFQSTYSMEGPHLFGASDASFPSVQIEDITMIRCIKLGASDQYWVKLANGTSVKAHCNTNRLHEEQYHCTYENKRNIEHEARGEHCAKMFVRLSNYLRHIQSGQSQSRNTKNNS